MFTYHNMERAEAKSYKTQLLTGKIITMLRAIMPPCQRRRKLDIIQFILNFGTTSQQAAWFNASAG